MRVKLFAPALYWGLSKKDKDSACDGCGAKGFVGWFVPETLWGLNILEACNIHDVMYLRGQTIEDKDSADRAFLNNMLRIINASGGGYLLSAMRRRRALKYYEAVMLFGGPAYWSGKNKSSEMSSIPV